MRIIFHRQHVLNGVTYDVGDVADVDPDVEVGLVDTGIASYMGGSSRHSTTWTDIFGSAAGINPAGTTAPPSVDTTETGWPNSLLFSGSADNLLAGMIQLPHEWKEGTAVHPHIHWMLTADSAAAVGWEFYYRISGIGDAAGDWVGPVAGTLSVTHGNVANKQALTSFGAIDMTGHTISTIIAWRLYRRGTTDANNADARLLFIDFHYQSDGTGSWAEYSKDG